MVKENISRILGFCNSVHVKENRKRNPWSKKISLEFKGFVTVFMLRRIGREIHDQREYLYNYGFL